MKLFLCALAWCLALPTFAHADCASDVNTAFRKLREAKAFRMSTKIVNPQGNMRMTVEYMPPDRMHQRIRLDNSAAEMEMIVIGAKAWSNQGQGWAELPEKFAGAVADQVKGTLVGMTNPSTAYTCGGEKDIDGKRMATFTAQLPAAEATVQGKVVKTEGPPNMQTVYIDVASGLPARNVVEDGKDRNMKLFDGSFEVSDEIKIEEPSVEPAPAKP